FTDAGKLMPGDRDAAALLAQATAGRDAAKTAADAEAKKKQEEAQRAEQVKQLLATGRTALAANNLETAAKAFGDAARLAPPDPAGVQAQKDLDAARAAAAADADRAKRTADYQAAMKTGRDAMQAKRYDDAIKAFTDAGKLMPGDRDAATLLSQAVSARDS